MKYSKEPYSITSDYAEELARKRNVFQSVTGTKSAVHSIMITTDGLVQNEHWGEVQADIQLNDLYELLAMANYGTILVVERGHGPVPCPG